MTHELWDGALAAYEEFVSRSEIENNIVFGKIGIIRKS
jgi:hypothetical protein